MKKSNILITVSFLFSTVVYSQQQAPDFSGNWKLNLSKSKLQAQWTSGLEKGKAQILHQEPYFRYWRSFTIKGAEDTLSFSMQTNGKEKIEKKEDRTVVNSLSWKQDTLLYISHITLGKKEAVNIAKYYLTENRTIFVTEEEFIGPRQKYRNMWVYEKD